MFSYSSETLPGPNFNMLYRLLLLACTVAIFSGCSSFVKNPQTVAATKSGYTYIPLDSFAVDLTDESKQVVDTATDASDKRKILELLPDNNVRVSVEQFDAKGGITYGIATSTAKGSTYKVTVDYINVDTVNLQLYIAKKARNHKTGIYEFVGLNEPNTGKYTFFSEYYLTERDAPTGDDGDNYVKVNIPIYVGIGLRVAADVESIRSNVKITSLPAISAAAEAGRVNGTLTIQTLGINGKLVSAALPLQSELNTTTAQNAVSSIGAIKALLYDENTVVRPRVVGIYLPLPGGKPLVNAIVSAISSKPVPWEPKPIN
ncbi:MAG: hypothetical protein AAGE65_05885 [Planctomycetota bacterium]